MTVTSEILHITTNKIYICNGFQLTPGTEEEIEFQNSTEKEILQNNKITFVRDYIELIEENLN